MLKRNNKTKHQIFWINCPDLQETAHARAHERPLRDRDKTLSSFQCINRSAWKEVGMKQRFHRTETQSMRYYHSVKRCRLSQDIIIDSFSSVACLSTSISNVLVAPIYSTCFNFFPLMSSKYMSTQCIELKAQFWRRLCSGNANHAHSIE